MTNAWNWHLGQGSLPSTEHGLDLSVRTRQMGDQVFAFARVGTPWGPVDLVARADMGTVQKILGATGDALQKICARLATEGVMKKVTEVTCSPEKSAAAERLYAKIRMKDPEAMRSVRSLIFLSKNGHQGAQEGVACLRQVYAKAKAVKVVAPASSASGCAGLDVLGSLDSPLRGGSYNPFAGDGAGFASRLPPPFLQTTNIMAGTMASTGAEGILNPGHGLGYNWSGWNNWSPYRPIPYGRLPVSYPPLPMGPYQGYASGIQQRQEASYISGLLNTGAPGHNLHGQGLSALLALGRRR
jgi:hypothetical protein